ncbi:DUF1906 domain-containing protein [Streptomyces syringium]|uniref:DUF1906 domain-containing protein n=1 Tax=Streptomyces syringium TaxID=76729 RepID=UPI003D8FD6C4
MDRRRKIIGYLVALTAAAAQVVGGAGPASAGDRGDPRNEGAVIFRGKGIDACQAPSLNTLSAWQSSPYAAVGVYFGGRARACPNQRYLSRRWLLGAKDLGWRVLPIYVGSQSPCASAVHKRGYAISDDEPWDQGIEEGEDAVRRASAYGIGRHSPLYLDMEAYNYRNADCARVTLSFIRGWTRAVDHLGYIPGFYSSANAGVRHMDLARRDGRTSLPEVMWFARWGVSPSTAGEANLGSRSWTPHRRIHQYAGNVTETYGGRTLTIDRNQIDAPVAIIR